MSPLMSAERATGWLIEPVKAGKFDARTGKYWRVKPGQHSAIGDPDASPCWIADARAALRFARREDAESYIAAALLGPVVAVEHVWIGNEHQDSRS